MRERLTTTLGSANLIKRLPVVKTRVPNCFGSQWGVVPVPWGDHPLVAHSHARYGCPSSKMGSDVKSVSQPIERRASRRFPLALPVLFRWTDHTEHYDVGHCAN